MSRLNIELEQDSLLVELQDVMTGGVFEFDGCLYMKTDGIRGSGLFIVGLQDGYTKTLDKETLVLELDLKVVRV